MPARNSKYWEERFTDVNEKLLNKADNEVIRLGEEYDKALLRLEKEIGRWYSRLAENNGLTQQGVKKLLKADELKEFHWTLEEYIRYGKENVFNQQWVKELENASAKVHITELEEMQIHLQQQVESLTAQREKGLTQTAGEIYTEGYYNSIFEIQKEIPITDFKILKEKNIKTILSDPWNGGRSFSEKIWDDRQLLTDKLNTGLIQNIIRGDSQDKLIQSIAKQFHTSKEAAGRLVLTESAYFASLSQLDSYKELGIKRYKIVATLDLKTSNICRNMDGMVLEVKYYRPGVSAPPFHPWCRSCTCPHLDDIENGQRIARDANGKNYYVSADLSYPKWYKKYVKGNLDEELKERRNQNRQQDKVQYNHYKILLGNEYVPKNVDEFQDMKYSNSKEYSILKAQVKGMQYYNSAIQSETDITKVITDTGDKIGMDTVGLEHRIKGKDSYLRKIRTTHKPRETNTYEIKDIIRYTYTASPDKLVEKALKSIDSLKELGYNTIEVKNSWLNQYNPYKGINTIVKGPDGQKFEIQYHTPESFELKNGKMHSLYEKQRLIEDEESEEYLALKKEMFQLSKQLEKPKGIERVK